MHTETVSMAHLGARAFEEIGGEVVQTTAFVRCANHIDGYKGTYCRLIEPTTQQRKEEMFLAGQNRYNANQYDFSKIPGGPIAYWVSCSLLNVFESPQKVSDYGMALQGSITGDNERFLRIWHEVNYEEIKFDAKCEEETLTAKWFPHNKGGSFRKWYGNFDYVVNYENSGKTICDYIDNTPGVRVKSNGRVINRDLYFHEGMTWSTIASGPFGMRYVPSGFIFEQKVLCAYKQGITSIFAWTV